MAPVLTARAVRGSPARLLRRAIPLLASAVLVTALVTAAPLRSSDAAARDDVRIAAAAPATFDPAAVGDSGSAAVTAQLFESLTAFDPALTLRPALAESWQVLDAGRRVVFTLRPGLRFSDGSPLTAADVVRSWLRLLDHASPSPLASLLDEVDGATAYRTGASTDPASVGFRSPDERTVEVRLSRPETDFPAIVSSPSFGVVPSGIASITSPAAVASSGGYRVAQVSATEITLTANDRYWAGRPAIGTIHLVTDLGGRSPVDAFEAGDVDFTAIAGYDASWIAYDRDLGPALRAVPSLGVTYYGFDTGRPPFDDARVRRAFAQAVDWRRLVTLASAGDTTPATSMVPPGVPGRSATDFLPAYDPSAARASLVDAGFPGGRGFPPVTLIDGGTQYDGAVVREIHDVLGITIHSETLDFATYFHRLETDPPAFWSLGWQADYPGANDFLGLLLGTGRTANYGAWSSAEFDAAIGDALTATDPSAVRAAFDRAQAIVQRDVPVVPVDYGQGWALARAGLLGAGQNGLSIIRLAGLAWSPG